MNTAEIIEALDNQEITDEDLAHYFKLPMKKHWLTSTEAALSTVPAGWFIHIQREANYQHSMHRVWVHLEGTDENKDPIYSPPTKGEQYSHQSMCHCILMAAIATVHYGTQTEKDHKAATAWMLKEESNRFKRACQEIRMRKQDTSGVSV